MVFIRDTECSEVLPNNHFNMEELYIVIEGNQKVSLENPNRILSNIILSLAFFSLIPILTPYKYVFFYNNYEEMGCSCTHLEFMMSFTPAMSSFHHKLLQLTMGVYMYCPLVCLYFFLSLYPYIWLPRD